MFKNDCISSKQNFLLKTENVSLDSGHYATKYYWHYKKLLIIATVMNQELDIPW